MHRREAQHATTASATITQRLVVGLVLVASIFFGLGGSQAQADPQLECAPELTEAQCGSYIECVTVLGVSECSVCLETMMADAEALCEIPTEPIIILHAVV